MLWVRRRYGGQDRAGETNPLPALVRPTIVDPGLANLHRPHARLQFTLWLMAIPHHQAMALSIPEVRVRLDVRPDLRLDGLGQHVAGSVPQNLRQHIPTRPGRKLKSRRAPWQTTRIRRNLLHGVSSVNG